MTEPISPENALELAPGIRVPERLLTFEFERSSGPGGQNVNKRSTRATLRLSLAALEQAIDPPVVRRLRTLAGRRVNQADELLLSSDESRSQHANRQGCIAQLGALLSRAAQPPKRRKRTKPSRASKQKRIEMKKQRGERKRARGSSWDA